MTSNAASSANDARSRSSDVVLWVTYVNIVLYALSYQLQRPVEPFLIKSLTEKSDGISSEDVANNYANLQSFFSFCQFFGSPLVGVMLDRIGIRLTSAIVFTASALSYAILAYANDLTLLFVSKIPTVFQAAFLVAQATAATAAHGDASLRAAALGRMTTAYTIGATIGPALGGVLAGHGDFYIGAKLAVVGSLVSVLLSLMFLPHGSGDADEGYSKHTAKASSGFGGALKSSLTVALRASIWPLLMVKVLGGVGASMHSTALPLVLTQTLGFEPAQLGFSMSCSMFAVAAFGAVAMAPLTNRWGSFGMMNVGLVSRAGLGLMIAAFVAGPGISENTMIKVIASSILYSLSQHILATGLTTQTTGSVGKDEQGALLGLEHALFSLARIVGPTLGTYFLGSSGDLWLVEAACGCLDLLLAVSLSVTLPKSSREAKKSC